MKKTVKIITLFDYLAFKIFVCFTAFVIISNIFVKPMYHYNDYPYFDSYGILDIAMFAFVSMLVYFVIRYRFIIEEKLNVKIITIIFFVLAILYIVFLPLEPFSDMKYVSEGAISLANLDFDGLSSIEYFKTFKGNVKTSLFFALPLLIMPKSLFWLKIINIVLMFLIGYLSMKIAEAYSFKYRKILFMLCLTFLPVFLYINNIYYELFFVFLLLLGIYVYRRDTSKILLSLLIIAIAAYLRKNGYIIMVAVTFDYLIINIHGKYFKKKIIALCAGILMFFSLNIFLNKGTEIIFYDNSFPSYPKWNQYYIGINEEKIGFMDQSFSYDRTLSDVINRIAEYGPIRISKILAQKVIWTWGEGTYQSGRYGFGLNTNNVSEKFSYSTFIEKYFAIDAQFTRRIITAFCRAQYMVYFVLMFYGIIKIKNRNLIRIGYLIFLGTFFALLLYEMKSRYIFHCFPFMLMYATLSFDKFGKSRKIDGYIEDETC